MRIAGGRGGASAEYLVRNGNVRVNLASPVGATSILHLSAESKTYMLMESQRIYMEMPAAATIAATASVGNTGGDAKISKTGRTETIAGVSCEHVIIETTGNTGPQKIDACFALGLGAFLNPLANPMAGGVPEWQRQLMKDGGFALRVTAADGSVPLEVTKIEKKRVGDELFRIPADYTKMDMPRRP